MAEIGENGDEIISSQSEVSVVEESGGALKRLSYFVRDQPPAKEMRRGYDDYFTNYDTFLSGETVKVEMDTLDDTIIGGSTPKNGRGRPKKHNDCHEWSDEATEALIHLWNQKEELYQKQHPYFYIREHKDKAVDSIRQSLEKQGYIVTCHQILSKFQSLRTYFCSQRNKLSQSKRNALALGHEDDIESKWRFYKYLMFLDENMKPRDTANSKKYNNNNNNCEKKYSVPDNLENYHQNVSMAYNNTTLDDGNHLDMSHIPGSYSRNSMVTVASNVHNGLVETNPEHRKTPVLTCERNTIYNNTTTTTTTTTHYVEQHSNSELHNSTMVSSHNGGTMTSSPDTLTSSHAVTSLAHHVISRDEDLIFGELVGNMLQKLPSGQTKDLLKLEIQQIIIKTKYTNENESSEKTSNE